MKQRKVFMPKPIDKTYEGQIIGGTFSNRENADKAVKAFEAMGISPSDIQMLVQNKIEAKESYTDVLSNRGFSESQARYYDKVVREGKILVTVDEVTDPAPI